MTKKDIFDLINKFESETWKYDNSNNLDNDMEYIYSIEKELKEIDESNIKPIYDKLISLIGMIRYKYGFESEIINSNPKIKEIVNNISLNSADIINQCNYVSTIYNDYISQIKNIDFIKNKYHDIQGKEGLNLAVESLKSLITNDSYKQLINTNQINEILIDCVKLNKGVVNIESLELKYKELINKIWEQSLSNKVNDNEKFKVLFSNISGGNLRDQANNLINRQAQSSCSMISSDFIATYGDNTRRIGFIYPNNSEIIVASAYDLGSNVFNSGAVNKEKGTILATPEVIEKVGKERAIKKGEDLYSSNSYNEILVNAKPCGIAVIGLGENDLNVDFEDVRMLSSEMNLPIYYVDTMKYKDKLSESDKNYITFHSILSYLGISRDEYISQLQQNNGYSEVYDFINRYKDEISEIFITLKNNGNLNKENMSQAMCNIVDISQLNSKRI